MRQAGLDAVLMDENLAFHRWLFSAEGVGTITCRIAQNVAARDEHPASTAADLMWLRSGLVAAARAPRLAIEIEDAVGILCSEAFYQPDKLVWAMDRCTDVLGLVRFAWPDTSLDLVAFEGPHDPTTPGGLARAVADRETNPYLQFYERFTIPRIRAIEPRLVGVSIAAETQWLPALTLLWALRRSGCDALLAVGGGVPTRLAGALADTRSSLQDYCDIVAVGQGEETIVDLAQRASAGLPASDVPGTIYYVSGRISVTPPRRPPRFADLPPPAFGGLPLGDYLLPEPVLPLMLARGCYARCSFCDHDAAYGSRRSALSPSGLGRQAASLARQHGVRHFAFADETLPPVSAARFADEVKGLGLHFAASFRLDRGWSSDHWRALSRGGFRLAQFGMESASQRVLDSMNKGTRVEHSARILRDSSDAGIWNHLFLMFGFPGETRADASETVEFIRRNGPIVHSVGASRFNPMRDSPVVCHAGGFGLRLLDAPAWSLALRYEVGDHGLSPGEAEEIRLAFQRDVVLSMSGARCWQRLERAQLAVLLGQLSRDDVLDSLPADLTRNSANGGGPDSSFPIDTLLWRMHNDATAEDPTYTREAAQGLPLLADGRSGEVALLTDEGFECVRRWRKGSSLEDLARALAERTTLTPADARRESALLLQDLDLVAVAEPGSESPGPLEGELGRAVDVLLRDIKAPQELPAEALPEWIAVTRGLKPGMRTTLYSMTEEALRGLARQVTVAGLSVEYVPVPPAGFAHLAPAERKRALADRPVFAFIGPSLPAVRDLIHASDAGACEFGRALGYPTCCVRWLRELDEAWSGRGRPPNLAIETVRCSTGSPAGELNNLLWFLPRVRSPFHLISHYPCSYRCAASLLAARRLHQTVSDVSPEFAVSLREVLCRPVVLWDDSDLPDERWDENKGLHLVGSAEGDRVAFRAYLSLRRHRDYSDLGLAFANELQVTPSRVAAFANGSLTGCWWAKDHGTPSLLAFEWGAGRPDALFHGRSEAPPAGGP